MRAAVVGVGLGIAAVAGHAGSSAEPTGGALVAVQMVASVGRAAAGQPLWVGLRYTVAPGWHIYWENPGDSGLATELTLGPGEGWTAGPVRYPGPDRYALPGDIVNYGYAGEAALLVSVTPDASLKPGDKLTIPWKSDWLVCHDECLRGSAEGTFSLPVAREGRSSATGALDPFLARLPTPAPEAPVWDGAAGRWTVRVPGAAGLVLFPNRALWDLGPHSAVQGDTVELTLTGPAPTGTTGLGGVIRVEGPQGPRWHSFDLPSAPPPAP